MRAFTLLACCAMLASCGGTPASDTDKAANSLGPGTILYPDIEANNLFGASCAFVPEGGGIGAIALVMDDAGYMKLNGNIVRFAKKDEAQQLGEPKMAFATESYALILSIDEATRRSHGDGGAEYDGQLIVRDQAGAEFYQANGLVQCSA